MSKHKLSIVLAVIVILTALIFIAFVSFKKQSRHTSQYEHVELRGPGYLINCAFLPVKQSGISKESVLIVYLHGLFANYEQPFETPSKYPLAFGTSDAFPKCTFFSCDYGTVGSWCNETDYKAITCSIEEISKRIPVSKIVMTGTSMGGCTALSYAANAPKNVKDKIVGVLAIYAAGDLGQLYKETKSIEVREALERAFNGPPSDTNESYSRASFIPNLSKLSPGTKVYIISALKDKVIPSSLQTALIEQLKTSGITSKSNFLPVYHVSVPAAEDFVEGLRFILRPGP